MIPSLRFLLCEDISISGRCISFVRKDIGAFRKERFIYKPFKESGIRGTGKG
jgi:hypothetical protein